MKKRGQITIFAIIGIIIIILILLLIFLKDRIYFGQGSQEDLESQFPLIKEHIEDCLVETALPRLTQIGLQGGYIETPEDTFRNYLGNKVSYLCYNIADQLPCRSRVLTLDQMEEELSKFIAQDLSFQCLNIQSFNKLGFNLNQGQLDLTTTISDDNVLLEAILPITISKGTARAEQSEWSATVNVPLGRLYQASRDTVNSRALIGIFDPLPYVILKTELTGKLYYGQRLPIYPDDLYIYTIKDFPNQEDTYVFQFFIEGEPR